MDKWEWERSYRNKGGSATSPSFSSSLLDAIDRSIDDGDGTARPPPAQPDLARNHQEAYRHKHSAAHSSYLHDDVAGLAHGWYAHRGAGNSHQPSLQLPQSKQRRGADRERGRRSSVCSVSSSSESSSAGGFSSSEAESVAVLSVRTKKPPLAVAGLADRSARLLDRDVPAAVKAGAAARKAKLQQQQQQQQQAQKLQNQQQQQQQHKDGAGTIKGRIRASRIYGELKKARSPVSPGGKLAAFLNTLFTNTNTRGGGTKSKSTCTSPRESAQQQQKLCPLPLPVNPPRLVIPPRPVQAWDAASVAAGTAGCIEDDSLCSSASSFSRSCLSKTPSTHGGGTKRSVRFCPVNVIVDDNYSRRFFQDKKPAYDAAAVYPYGSAAAALKRLVPLPPVEVDGDVEFYDDEDDDGTASCSSSDLFELENLAGVGGSRYADELPVYETTHLRTNRAIAQGLIV